MVTDIPGDEFQNFFLSFSSFFHSILIIA
jgi:hypothetical protein